MGGTQTLGPAPTPDRTEKVLGLGALALLAAVVLAVLRGRPHWADVPPIVWLHLATIAVALLMTPVMLWRRRGDGAHRLLGYAWAGAIGVTALATFGIRQINAGGFSVIHLLSVWTLYQLVVIVLAARRGNVARHRLAVRGMVIGALLIAGFFTFSFDRMLGRWLLG